jgi:adenylate cyclase
MISIHILSIAAVYSMRAFANQANIDIEALGDQFLAYWMSSKQFVESFIFSILFAILFVLVNAISHRFKWDRFSFSRVILLKTGVYFLGALVIVFFISGVIFGLGFIDYSDYQRYQASKYEAVLLTIVPIYLIFLVILLNFIIQTAKKIGNQNLYHFLTGKYHKPVLEDRIFLFLDMKSSTTFAEQLGSQKYSRLIKDCFDDLNYLVNQFYAEIYQYVGDETVLTWKMNQGLKDARFLKVFFAFQKALRKRKHYYVKEYGTMPEFKAGAHGGELSVSEVGNIRRDIAYYGDVINTASRIQSICNQYHEHFLISGSLIQKVNVPKEIEVSSIGKLELRGRVKMEEIFAARSVSGE